jgi:hypothetical protein
MWGAIAGIGASLLGGLLGGGGPKIDESNYNEAMQWLSEQYQNAQNPYYEGVMRQMIDYFAGGGSATDSNRQKAFSQVLAPINTMIPDARTRIQNAMSRAGILTPGTVQNKFETDIATKAAFQRGQAIESVNQRFDERQDQNKALGLSASQQFASLLRNLSMQAAGQKGQLALGQQAQQLQRSTMGTNWGQMLMGLGGSMIGNWANGPAQAAQAAPAAPMGFGAGGSLLNQPVTPGFSWGLSGGFENPYQSPYYNGANPL